jgi:predicted dehydrogenase
MPNWGILGTGSIAHLFAEDLTQHADGDLVAVGSRSAERAEAFGERFGAPHRHGGYDALVADASVDVVYVASPHPFHAEHTRLALEAGKAVLCEKPLTLNAASAERLAAEARERGLFLMEAMWTRFLPPYRAMREVVNAGTLGPVQVVEANIGMVADFDPSSRVFDPALGGGALLDLGVYPVGLALDLLGTPDAIATSAVLGETGVDEQCGAVFTYAGGAQATWHASVRADAGRTCAIAGPNGRLEGQRAWWKGAPFALTRDDGSTELVSRPFAGTGYQFEATHVAECLREGRTESPVMPLDASIDLLRVADRLRAEWGLTYPQEDELPASG